MEIILLERIENLGQMGDVVSVKPGFARNYLLPRGKALRATEENRRTFEQQRTQLEADNLEGRKEAEAVAKKIEGLSIVLVRQAGEAGQLYGSANARDIADAVCEAGCIVTRQQVRLQRPIKLIGIHPVRIDLHPEVSVDIITNVARTQEEAEIQARTGKALIHADEEESTRAAPAKTDVKESEETEETKKAEDGAPTETEEESGTGDEEAGEKEKKTE
ncbi:MAG: 50S ribosomal protein L9 [Rhodospirillales bacterium]|jgi:large subunit ribosomal protein L9|nr:50S ribosomal protein L9 [Rhodospirillales bacterium]